jgi:zinc/manganese transport system substrate-binding protein
MRPPSKMLRLFAVFLIAGFDVLCGKGADAADKIEVVTTFSILGDLAREVGGDRVAVTTIVAPNGDAHAFHPTPADARRLGSAKVLVINGLGLEGWIARLREASDFRGIMITANKGVKPHKMLEHSETLTDPHAWQDLQNGKLYVANIRDGLIEAAPQDKAIFEANAQNLTAESINSTPK